MTYPTYPKTKFSDVDEATTQLREQLDSVVASLIVRLIDEKGVDMASEILAAIAAGNAEINAKIEASNAKIEASNAKIEAKIETNNAEIRANNAEIKAMKESIAARLDGVKDKVDAVKHFNLVTVITALAAIIGAIMSFVNHFTK